MSSVLDYGRGVKRMKQITSNWGLKLVSLAIAIVLWLIVVNIDDPVTKKQFYNIPVEMIHEEALDSVGKVYEVTEGSVVSVTVEGKRSLIDNLKNTDFIATADLSKLSITNAVPIEVSLQKYADRVTVTLGKVNTVTVNLEDVKKDTFPIKVVTSGDVAQGYAIGVAKSTPNMIEVSGPKSVINQISEVRVTVNVKGIYKDLALDAKPSFYNQDGEKIDNSRLTTNVDTVGVVISLQPTKEIPIVVGTKGEVAEGYELVSVDYEPKNIFVTGRRKALDRISQIEIKDLDISNLKEETEINLDLSQYLPENISLVDTAQNLMIKIKVEKKEKEKIEILAEDISIVNPTEGYSYRITKPSKITFYMIGLQRYLKKTLSTAFEPTIDVSNLPEGVHQVPVILKELEHITVNKQINVEVTVTKKEEASTQE